jgi:alpha-tubulin suppressor-like RCC1 family protein
LRGHVPLASPRIGRVACSGNSTVKIVPEAHLLTCVTDQSGELADSIYKALQRCMMDV